MDSGTIWGQLIAKLGAETIGVILAVTISVLRIYYDASERKPLRILIEASLCGCLALAASSGVKAMGLDPDAAIFVGGVIGYLGPVGTREIAMRMFNKRVS